MSLRSTIARLLLQLFLLAAAPACLAATPEEDSAFEALTKQFKDGLSEAVEKEATQFLLQYTNSERLAEIVLFQAQARLQLGRFAEAGALLGEKAGVAGKLADEFAFWLAEAKYRQKDYPAAADAFGVVARQHAGSPRRLQAAYYEAYARLLAGDRARCIALLEPADSPFAQTAQAQPDAEWSLRGRLLLGECLWLEKQHARALAALAPLAGRKPPPDLEWHYHLLLTRLYTVDGKFQEAIAHATNLWTAVTNSVSPDLLVEAANLNGEAWEKLQQPTAALGAYERNLLTNVAEPARRHALQRVVDITLRQFPPKDAAARLEAIIASHPNDPVLDLARLPLGEMSLRNFYTLRAQPPPGVEGQAAISNAMAQAKLQFDLLVTNHPASPLAPKASLDRGWCLWEAGTNRWPEAVDAFRMAAGGLTDPMDQAIARFKWADCQFHVRDFAGAASNYWLIATNGALATPAKDALPHRALYQVVRASIAGGDLERANQAMKWLLQTDPGGELADRAELIMGQALTRQGQPQAAREFFLDFTKRFTNSVLLPEVRLAIARTYERELAWAAARTEYGAWAAAYGSATNVDPNLASQALFAHARVSYQLNPDTNALELLTGFVNRFPEHTNAPVARYLMAEYAFAHADYERAELLFQDKPLLQNTNAAFAELAYQARLMAGRAAVAGQRYRNARDAFDWLITNGPLYNAQSPIPVSLVAEAYLFRGDTFILEPAEGTNRLARFGEAITAFTKVAEHFSTNEFAAAAWGRIGDCHLQLATLDPAQGNQRYESAAEAYRRVVESSAPVSLRSKAEKGLGIVRAKQATLRPSAEQAALLDQALAHFLRVAYAKNLRAGEQADPLALQESTLEAIDLLEQLAQAALKAGPTAQPAAAGTAKAEAARRLDEAMGLCRRLQTELPVLKERMDRRLDQLQKQREALAP
jgi:outer membrane protein assembly factor BamD (BamD/ComL family)